MKKILNFNYPIITTYTHHAHLLGILSNSQDAMKWAYSNYIQVYINKDLSENMWGDFYFPMPYEIKNLELCKWIETQKILEKSIIDDYEDIVSYIEKSVKRGMYVHLMVNFRFISGSYCAHDIKDAFHDLLVIGYDDISKVFVCADFKLNINNKYEVFECTYEDLRLAFMDAHKCMKDSYLNHMVYLYRLKDQCDYEFDINNIVFGLSEYLFGNIPEYWKEYNYANLQNVTFGIKYYDVICSYLSEYNPYHINTSIIYLMYDHKKMMIERLKELCEHNKTVFKYIEMYKQMYDEMQIIVNLTIKYDITHNKNLINKIIQNLIKVKEHEERVLGRLIVDLGANT